MALAASVHQAAPATTAAAFFQVASCLFMLSTLAIGSSVGIVAGAEHRIWLRGLGLVTAGVPAIAGLSAAYPHGPMAVALLPAWRLLIIWLASGAIAALRTRSRPAAEPAAV